MDLYGWVHPSGILPRRKVFVKRTSRVGIRPKNETFVAVKIDSCVLIVPDLPKWGILDTICDSEIVVNQKASYDVRIMMPYGQVQL